MTAARKLTEEYRGYVSEEQTIFPEPPRPRKKNFRLPTTVKICLLAAICVAISLFYLEQQVTCFHLNMQLAQLREQVDSLEQRNDYLRVSLEKQRSLQQVEYLARTELGMVEPNHTTNLVVNSQRRLTSGEGRWVENNPPAGRERGIFAALAGWLNKAFPIGGVEAGTLQR